MLQLKAPAQLNITMVEHLVHEWQGALHEAGNTTLDMSEVQKIDSAGLQLIVALKHSLHKMDYSLSLVDVPESVQSVFTTVGLENIF